MERVKQVKEATWCVKGAGMLKRKRYCSADMASELWVTPK